MKKKLALIMAVASVMAMQSSVYAQDDVTVIVNGDTVELDQPPVIENGRQLKDLIYLKLSFGQF